MSKRNNPKWYAVRKGRKPGIYNDWNECNAQVAGFKGSEFKSFVSEKEAKEYLSPVGEKRKLEALLSSNSNVPVANEEPPQKVQKIAKNITLILENDKIVLQNEHGEVHIDHDLSTITKVPHDTPTDNSPTRSPRKERKPRNRKRDADKNAQHAQESNSEGKVDAAMLQNYGTTANSEQQPVVVFIDGACTNNGTPHAKAGYGAFFGKDDKRNISLPLEGTKQTNQRAEIMAAIAALRQVGADKPVELRTDSHYVMKAMTEWMPNWKKTNFKKTVENLDLFKILDEIIMNREAKVLWTYVPAHTGIYGNEKADELAKKGANHTSFTRGLHYLAKLEFGSVSIKFPRFKWLVAQAINLQKLELPCSDIYNYQLKELLQLPHLTHLRSLNLTGADLSLINFDELCARFSSLEALDMTGVKFLPDRHLVHLTRIQPLRALVLGDEVQSLRPIQDLTHLTAFKIKISNKFFWEPHLWALFTNLEVLDLCLPCTSRDTVDFPSHALTRVTQLTLNDSSIDGPLLLRLMALPNLERLSLDRSHFGLRTAEEFMAGCTALTHLSGNKFRGYLNGLAKLTQLRELHLMAAVIFRDDLQWALESLTGLRSLSFSVSWPLTKELALPLLMRLRKLRALEIGLVSHVEEALPLLCEHLTNLRSLDLSESSSQVSLADLTRKLIGFPHLARFIMPGRAFEVKRPSLDRYWD